MLLEAFADLRADLAGKMFAAVMGVETLTEIEKSDNYTSNGTDLKQKYWGHRMSILKHTNLAEEHFMTLTSCYV
jgi:hypothetical protein